MIKGILGIIGFWLLVIFCVLILVNMTPVQAVVVLYVLFVSAATVLVFLGSLLVYDIFKG